MNLLVLSNMAPGKRNPLAGIFIQKQVDELKRREAVSDLQFVAITTDEKGKLAVIRKYGKLLIDLFSKAIFSRKHYSVVHVHYFWPTIICGILYKLLRNPAAKIVVTFHGSDIYSIPNPPIWYRFAGRFVCHHIFVSDGLRQRYFNQQIPYDVLCAGIDDFYQPQAVSKKYDVIMVGVVEKNKGIDRLMAILDQLPMKLRICVVGDGTYMQHLKAYVNPNHQLDLLGYRLPDEVIGYLNQSRFLLSLSRNESFGLVMSEAMACGIPVIAAKTDGSLAQVREGENGFLIENQEQGFASQASEVITKALTDLDGDKYEAMCKQALADAQSRKLSSVVDRLLQIYSKVEQLH